MTADFGRLLEASTTLSQSYADDLQAYVHCQAAEAAAAVRKIGRATEILEAWMSSNRLRLNTSKTQYIWLRTRQQVAKIDMESLETDTYHGQHIQPMHWLRN